MTHSADQIRELVATLRELGVVRFKDGDLELMLGDDPKAKKAAPKVAREKPIAIRTALKSPTQTSAGGSARSDAILFRSGAR